MLHLRPNAPVEVKERVAPKTEGDSKEAELATEETPKTNKTEKKG